MGRVTTETLGRWAYVATIIGVPLLLAALLLGYYQMRDANKAARLTNFITLTNEFFNPTNIAIISAIEEGKPILIENKGKYTDAHSITIWVSSTRLIRRIPRVCSLKNTFASRSRIMRTSPTRIKR